MNWCRICRRQRPESGKCSSCGTGLTPYYEPKAKAPSPSCPKCRGKHTQATPHGSRVCRDCGAEFEPVEVGYLDTRPDVNAEKRERRR
jgi:DNA-directed RNA polymerase subunit RPC12/RpoP